MKPFGVRLVYPRLHDRRFRWFSLLVGDTNWLIYDDTMLYERIAMLLG
jgi:hypothetical protein